MALRRRDAISYVLNLPSSVLLFVCLFLPQQRTCQGHVETPIHNGTGALLIGLALLGLVPLLWRVATLRPALGVLVAIVLVAMLATSPIGLGILVALCIFSRWMSTEQLAAVACAVLAMLFVIVFPFVFLLSTEMDGGVLTWLAALGEVAGFCAWWSIAISRQREQRRPSALALLLRKPML